MSVAPWPAQIFYQLPHPGIPTIWNFCLSFFYLWECDNCKIKNWDYRLLWKRKSSKKQVGFLATINILLEKLTKNVRKWVQNHQILLNIGRKIIILQWITMSYVILFINLFLLFMSDFGKSILISILTGKKSCELQANSLITRTMLDRAQFYMGIVGLMKHQIWDLLNVYRFF